MQSPFTIQSICSQFYVTKIEGFTQAMWYSAKESAVVCVGMEHHRTHSVVGRMCSWALKAQERQNEYLTHTSNWLWGLGVKERTCMNVASLTCMLQNPVCFTPHGGCVSVGSWPTFADSLGADEKVTIEVIYSLSGISLPGELRTSAPLCSWVQPLSPQSPRRIKQLEQS